MIRLGGGIHSTVDAKITLTPNEVRAGRGFEHSWAMLSKTKRLEVGFDWQWSGWGGRWEGGSGWGRHVNPRPFHFNVWKNLLKKKKKKSKERNSENSELRRAMGNQITFSLRVSHSPVRLSATRGLWPTRLFCPWNSPDKNTGVRSHSHSFLPDSEIEPGYPALQADSLLIEPPWKPNVVVESPSHVWLFATPWTTALSFQSPGVQACCPSLSPRVCSDSHALNQWCHPTISSSIIPFSSCLQVFPALGSFPMSRLFASGG